ncbi:obscurin-like, partial [Stegastes partitus]|uniref:Obscurin-like n=1 Tax=Stegastes partitus TaxID=144197 RepID=A0A9Y4NWL4_9TELE
MSIFICNSWDGGTSLSTCSVVKPIEFVVGTKWTYSTDRAASVKVSELDLKMGHSFLCVLLFHFVNTLLYYGHAQDAVLTTDPNCSSYFVGESVTFICDMNEGEDAEWEYKINKDGRTHVQYNTHKRYTFGPLSTDDSGEYQCVGRRKSSYETKNSNTVSLSVSAVRPRATLTAGPTTISVGGSVTLTCSVQNSDGWKYYWYRRTQVTSAVPVDPVRVDDEQNRVIRVSQGGIYRCSGGRGKPVYYTISSYDITIVITFSNEAVLTQQPHWPQLFSGETITLTCEVHGGGTTEWMYEWKGPMLDVQWTYNNYQTFSVSESSSGDYMCRSRPRDDSYSSTQWSKAVTLSVSGKPKALINADVREIPVGGSVTLICSVNPSSGWKYYWYRDETSSEALTTKDAVFQSNGQIRVSQEGVYWCRGGRGNPVYHTEFSDPVTINKKEAKAVLTVSPSWLSPGASVTLSCQVEHPSAGWRFYWYKAVPDLSDNSYSYELLPGSSNGTEEDSYIVDGQTQTAGYACRAGRGDPVHYTDDSEPQFVWSG